MTDPTEAIRRQMVADINAEPGSQEYLEAKHGRVWDTDQVREQFEVLGFMAPFVIVRRRSDGVRGSLCSSTIPGFTLSSRRSRPFKAAGLSWHCCGSPAFRLKTPASMAEETQMTEKKKDSITTVLKDVEHDHEGSLRVRVVANEAAISICPEGYGDFGSAEGHGCPIFLELHRGRLRLVVFADINREDPPRIIDLEDTREDRRNETE